MDAFAHVGTHEEGIMLEDAFKLRVHIRRGAFGVKMVDVNVLEFASAASVAQGFNKALRHIRHRTDVDMVARLNDFDGFFGRNCLILFLHN